MFCACAGSAPWIERISHRFFEVSFQDTFRRLVDAYRAREGMSARAFGTAALGDHNFMRRWPGRAGSLRLDTVDRVLAFIGEPAFGPLFRAEVEAYLAVTGTKAYLLGELAVKDASFVTRLRAGTSPTLGTVDSVRTWMGEHSTAPERRAIGAATLHTGWWRQGLGAPEGPTAPADAARNGDAPGPYLTTRQAAVEMNVSARTFRRLRTLGQGPPYHEFGRQIRYARADLEAWAGECRRQPAGDRG